MADSEDNGSQTRHLDPATQRKLQNFFNKGFAAFERGAFDMAVELLYQCVEIEPGFARARKFLRSAAMQRFAGGRPSKMKIQLSELSALGAFMKASSLRKSGKTREALLASEKLIEQAPFVAKYVILAAECTLDAGYPDSAVMLLDTALQVDLQNEQIMSALVDVNCKAGDWKKAREIIGVLVNKHPQDGALMSKLKDVEARMTMANSWDKVANSDEKEGFRKLIKNKDQAQKLDMANKAVVADGDADTLIAEQRAKIAADPKNINYYRALARIFIQKKMFEDAVSTLEDARKINSTDPELDRLLSNTKAQAFDARIEALRQEGRDEEAEALTTERNQFVFDDLVQRVERYPNDLRLRFELGQQYLTYEAYDDAIQQFQLSQRSPKERSESLYGLSQCFRAKGQRDMAIMQLEAALEQLPVMNDMRKAVLFSLGELTEENGEIERAFKLYREVYGADIGYKDIDKKMERIYQLRKEQQGAQQ